MALMTYIRKHPKTGVYKYRRVVPEALRVRVGRREIRRTLGTRDANEAKRLGHEVAAEVDRLLQEAEAGTSALSAPSENISMPIVKRPTRVELAPLAEALAEKWRRENLAMWRENLNRRA